MSPSEDPALAPDTVLVRDSDIAVRLRQDEDIRIEIADAKLKAPRLALALLDAFSRPRTVGDVLAEIGARGPTHFIEASSTLLLLLQAGVLRAPGTKVATKVHGYVKPGIHIAMLDDHARTRRFCEAIRAVVSTGDVVVDIGTGTGVLATCAAQAGASRVYALESSGIADVAEQVFATNGVGDRVTLLRQRSTQADLPTRAHVLVTEMIGNDPLDEHLLEIVADAKQRLLAGAPRIVPSRIEVHGIPLAVPDEVVQKHLFTRERLATYHADYGVDFAPLLEHRLPEANATMFKTAQVTSWPLAGAPFPIADVDLEGDYDTTIAMETSFELTNAASRLAVALAFRATLAPGIVLSTLPDEVDPRNHWRYATYFAPEDLGARAGDRVRVEYRYAHGTSGVRFAR